MGVAGAGGRARRSASALRLWGVAQGLPYAYNTDEADHFVPHAVAMFQQHSLNPHYFANPPAFTYVLHFLFALAYGGGRGVRARTSRMHPARCTRSRASPRRCSATVALWLLYATGARLFGRGVGLLAAAIEAVAFLPVFYAHLALNDVPTLAPLTLSLLGTAGVLRKGRARDYLLAGAGLGLACATKYTAGIVLVPLAGGRGRCATWTAARGRRRRARSRGLALAAAAALAAFLHRQPLRGCSTTPASTPNSCTSRRCRPKRRASSGAPRQGGLVYYLWSLTWGLGWVPALAALGGAVVVWRARAERSAGCSSPRRCCSSRSWACRAATSGAGCCRCSRSLCLLAASSRCWCAERAGTPAAVRRRGPAAARGGGARGAARRSRRSRSRSRLLAQGLVYSVHSGLVLSRADTRNLTRAWMVAHVPARRARSWSSRSRRTNGRANGGRDATHELAIAGASTRRCCRASRPRRAAASGGTSSASRTTSARSARRCSATTAPRLLLGACSGSTQSGRAFADPRGGAAARSPTTARSRRQGEVVYRASPYARGQGPVAFGFDWSFDYYPLAYHRPGPAMTIYRLHGGRCGR